LYFLVDLRGGLQDVFEDKVKSSVLQSGQIFDNRMDFFLDGFGVILDFFGF